MTLNSTSLCLPNCAFLFYLVSGSFQYQKDADVQIRINQLGYLEKDSKVAIVFSKTPIGESFQLINKETGKVSREIKALPLKNVKGPLSHCTNWKGRKKVFSKAIPMELLIDTMKKHGPTIWNGVPTNCIN